MPIRPGQAKAPSVSPASGGGGGVTGLANPTGTIGLTAVNGVLTTAMRSDGAPALSQSIAPTWTGIHTWASAANSTQTIFQGFAGQTAVISKWQSSAAVLLASIAASGRIYTANNLEVLDTFGALSSVAPAAVPANCSVGLTYIYDTATYFNSSLWTNAGDTAVVKDSPLAYGTLQTGTNNGNTGQIATLTSTSLAWTTISITFNVKASGRGTYSGTMLTNHGVTIGSTLVAVEYSLTVTTGNLILNEKITDGVGGITTNLTTLGPILGVYSVSKVLKFVRANATAGAVDVYIDGVQVLTGTASGLTGNSTLIAVTRFQSIGSNGSYDTGSANSTKNYTTFNDVQFIGNSMATSCTLGANVDRQLVSRQGTEIQIGANGGWTALRHKTIDGGVMDFVSGATTIATWGPAGITNSVQVTNSSRLLQLGTMTIGASGPQTIYALGIENTVVGLTGATQYGIACQPTFDSTPTTAVITTYSRTILTAAAYTVVLGRGVFIDTPVLGTGSAITTYAALDIATQNKGGTNYAIRTGATGLIQLGSLTASLAVFTDGSKNLVSNAITGTGSVVMSSAAVLTGILTLKSQTFSNAAVNVTATTMYLAQTGTMSASRVVTLAAANVYPRGTILIIADESGTTTATNTLVITAAGADTINGAATLIIGLVGGYNTAILVSGGTSKWTVLNVT